MRVSANTPYIRTPRTQKRTSRTTLVIMLITLLLPPLGLVLLWRAGRCPLRGKVFITMLGIAVMVLAFSLYISRHTPVGIDVPIEYTNLSVTPVPTEAVDDGELFIAPQPDTDGQPQNGAGTGGSAGQTDGTDLQNGQEDPLSEDIIPANPTA